MRVYFCNKFLHFEPREISLKNKLINDHFLKTQTVPKLMSLAREYQHQMNAFNLVTFINRLSYVHKNKPQFQVIHDSYRFLEKLTDYITDKMNSFNFWQLSNIAAGCSSLLYENRLFFGSIARQIVKGMEINDPVFMHNTDGKSITKLLWAFSVPQIKIPVFNASLMRAFKQTNYAFNDYVSCVRTLAILDDRTHRAEFIDLFEKANQNFNPETITPSIISSLVTLEIYSKFYFPELNLQLDPKLKQKLNVEESCFKTTSTYDISLSDILNSIQVSHRMNYRVTPYQMDCADIKHQINFEIDNDHHHYTSKNNLLGKNKLRDLLLGHLGWRVVRIKHSQWNSKNRQQKMDLLESFYR